MDAELRVLFGRRREIVDCIATLLSSMRSGASGNLESCFPGSPARELEREYWAAGFAPRVVEHLHNDLAHPAELMLRGVHCWRQTHWPGRGERVHYAHTLFNLYILRCLEFLSLRLRVADVQELLDELWRGSPAAQPVLVRDARWLIPLAQSLITDDLAPYFEMARRVDKELPAHDALEVWRAHVRMLGGHLCSQIRHYCTRDGLALDDLSVVLRTRSSNALDLALLVQGLVALLQAYGQAAESQNEELRVRLASAILQGISPDPELFLNRVELLGAYSMIELVSVERGEYSAAGARHVELLKDYAALIGSWRRALREDAPRFRPRKGEYSSYGVLFGLPTTLIEHMALKTLDRNAETRFSLEDVFDDSGGAAKLAWVNGWRELPHIPREVQQAFEFPQEFAEEIFARIERELARDEALPLGRLYIGSTEGIPELSTQFIVSGGDRRQFMRDRQEAHFLVSYETSHGWVALRKELLTEVLGAGRDVTVRGLPDEAAAALRLMNPLGRS